MVCKDRDHHSRAKLVAHGVRGSRSGYTGGVVNLSDEQCRAIRAVEDWYANPNKRQFFYLAGPAGCGKTSIAKELAIPGTLFAAYTGKAAHVLRDKGCDGARTIHSLVYRPTIRSHQHLRTLRSKLKELEPGTAEYCATELDIEEECDRLKQPAFARNEESDVRDAPLIVIDECSMLSGRIVDDLLSFQVPILVLGDPFQLPPVKGAGFFTNREPDFELTEIHRQAQGSPVLRLATQIRLGEQVEADTIKISEVTSQHILDHDQVLCGTNKRRKQVNQAVRRYLGTTSHLPQPGDKLVCLRNNSELGLLNGQQWTTIDCTDLDDDQVNLVISDGELQQSVIAWKHYFEDRENELSGWVARDAQSFDYAYAMTVHKAQGSQWGSVLLVNESDRFRPHHRQWLYTGITRASERVTVAI